MFYIGNIFLISKHTQLCAHVSLCVHVYVARQLLTISRLRVTYHSRSRKMWKWFRLRVTAVAVYAVLEGNECVCVDKVDNC
jgi:hypothetical protein